MDSISYDGKEYPLRYVYIPTFGERWISTLSLEDRLINEDGYAEEDARLIDDLVFFYVPDRMIRDPEAKLSQYVFNGVGGEELKGACA